MIRELTLAALAFAAAAFALCGCTLEKAVVGEAYGARVTSESASVGRVKLITIPKTVSFFRAEYDRSTSIFGGEPSVSWSVTWADGESTNAAPASLDRVLDSLVRIAAPTNSAARFD